MYGTLEDRVKALEARVPASPAQLIEIHTAIAGAQATADECARVVGNMNVALANLEARLNSIGVRLSDIERKTDQVGHDS